MDRNLPSQFKRKFRIDFDSLIPKFSQSGQVLFEMIIILTFSLCFIFIISNFFKKSNAIMNQNHFKGNPYERKNSFSTKR